MHRAIAFTASYSVSNNTEAKATANPTIRAKYSAIPLVAPDGRRLLSSEHGVTAYMQHHLLDMFAFHVQCLYLNDALGWLLGLRYSPQS